MLYIEKGAKTIFLKYARNNINNGKKAAERITSENELETFFDSLKNTYESAPNDKKIVASTVCRVILSEIIYLSSEIDVTYLQAYNATERTKASFNESYMQKINKESKKVEEKVEELNRNLKNQKDEFESEIKDTKKNMYESNITILGIFSAVVLAFNGALTFSASVFDNIGESSVYRILMVSLIIGFVIINVLCGLFYYLEKIRLKDGVKKDRCKSLVSLIISDAVILLMMAGVVGSWWCGKVEKRDEKYINETQSSISASEDTTSQEQIKIEIDAAIDAVKSSSEDSQSES